MIRSAKLETLVGIFLLLGVGFICGVILLLAEMPDLFKPTYNLTVLFPDASGLLRGSDVDLRGALIGKVTSNPHLTTGALEVAVTLKIDRSVEIRQGAQFTIESSGLLGDKFIEVRPKVNQPGVAQPPYLHDDEVVQGSQAPDLSTLMAKSLPLIHRANHVAAQLDDIITRLNTNVLDATGTKNMKEIVVKLREVDDDSDSLIKNANGLIAQVKSGNGALGELLYDKQVRTNLADFMANLKAHGLIFYSDDFGAPESHTGSRPPWRARP